MFDDPFLGFVINFDYNSFFPGLYSYFDMIVLYG